MIIQFKKPKEWQIKYNESSRNNKVKDEIKKLSATERIIKAESWFFQKKIKVF